MYIAPGHGHTTTCYKFWQHFKAFIIPCILYQFQKNPFCLINLYNILFYFIYVYIAPGQGETTLGDSFLMEAERSYILITGCMFKKISLPFDLCTFFHDFVDLCI